MHWMNENGYIVEKRMNEHEFIYMSPSNYFVKFVGGLFLMKDIKKHVVMWKKTAITA
jgi:hypothetical protein